MRARSWVVRVVVLLVVQVCGLALAADIGIAEKRWIRQCVESLASASAAVSESAEHALAALDTDCVPYVLPYLAKLRDDHDWDALGRALARMGQKRAAEALDACRDQWPKDHRDRLNALHGRLAKGDIDIVAAAAAPAPAGLDPQMLEAVRTLLEPLRAKRIYSSEEPVVGRLVMLGHGAVPALVHVLRDAESDRRSFVVYSTAEDALAALARDGDVGLLRQALLDGHAKVAKALGGLKTPLAITAFTDAIANGICGYEVVAAIERHADNKAIRRAVVGYLEAYGAVHSWQLSAAAKFVGEHGYAEAVPGLRVVVAEVSEGAPCAVAARSLALLGQKDGIRALIDVLAARLPAARSIVPGRSAAHSAGESLNELTGKAFYRGSFAPGGAKGNFAEAVAKYDAWWTDVGERLAFDPVRRRWAP